MMLSNFYLARISLNTIYIGKSHKIGDVDFTIPTKYSENVQRFIENNGPNCQPFSIFSLIFTSEITFHDLLPRKLHKFTTSNQLKIRCVYELLHTITMKEMIKIGGQKQALSITNICYILHVHTVVCFVYSNKPLSFIILKRKCLIAIKCLSNENK